MASNRTFKKGKGKTDKPSAIEARKAYQARRNLPCDTCGEKFSCRFNLMQHVRSTHTYSRPFACGCGKSYARRWLLNRHVASMHPDRDHRTHIMSETIDDLDIDIPTISRRPRKRAFVADENSEVEGSEESADTEAEPTITTTKTAGSDRNLRQRHVRPSYTSPATTDNSSDDSGSDYAESEIRVYSEKVPNPPVAKTHETPLDRSVAAARTEESFKRVKYVDASTQTDSRFNSRSLDTLEGKNVIDPALTSFRTQRMVKHLPPTVEALAVIDELKATQTEKDEIREVMMRLAARPACPSRGVAPPAFELAGVIYSCENCDFSSDTVNDLLCHQHMMHGKPWNEVCECAYCKSVSDNDFIAMMPDSLGPEMVPSSGDANHLGVETTGSQTHIPEPPAVSGAHDGGVGVDVSDADADFTSDETDVYDAAFWQSCRDLLQSTGYE